jgi:virulence factor Mce-like protein
MKRRRSRVSNLAAGIIGAVVILAACYLVFGGSLPFSGSPYMLKAIFTSETQLGVQSPVRIAGVDVGRVESVQRISSSSTAAVVTMGIDRNGLPIHANATARIRPRIFLEGNFYVDLNPGTPGAPILPSGGTLPPANTSGPVQLDRVLASLNTASRVDLQTLLQGFGAALNEPGGTIENASQDPSVRKLTGGQALNASLAYSAAAFKASAIVNEALLGTQPHDLSGVVSGNARVFQALAKSGNQLASFVSSFDATMATLASRQQQLGATIAALPPLLRNADSAFSALDASFPPTKAFARDILPGIRQLDPTIGEALPWLSQASLLLSPNELGGLLATLSPAVQQTSSALRSTKSLLSAADQFARCVSHNLVPTGNAVIQDGSASTGRTTWQELLQSAVGLAGAAGNFDGNGRYIRATQGGGSFLVSTPPLPVLGPLFGNAVLPVLGTRPAWPGQAPPLRRGVACAANGAPNVNNVATGAGP